MGCDNCNSKEGCTDRKSDMLGEVSSALETWYPTQTWGIQAGAFPQGVSLTEVEEMAEFFGEALRAMTWVRPGGPMDFCDYLYILCMGRTPAIGAIRDTNLVATPEQGATDLCLRVAFSNLERMAVVQQVAIEAHHTGAGIEILERPRAGVYDAPLLKRFRTLVTLIKESDILHVDFGEIDHGPEDYKCGTYHEYYKGEPTVANFLFFAEPANTDRRVLLEELTGQAN